MFWGRVDHMVSSVTSAIRSECVSDVLERFGHRRQEAGLVGLLQLVLRMPQRMAEASC